MKPLKQYQIYEVDSGPGLHQNIIRAVSYKGSLYMIDFLEDGKPNQYKLFLNRIKDEYKERAFPLSESSMNNLEIAVIKSLKDKSRKINLTLDVAINNNCYRQ
ncbi:MAG: hypothetical protein AABW56_01655 [Nanoarchaeota archaeon]